MRTGGSCPALSGAGAATSVLSPTPGTGPDLCAPVLRAPPSFGQSDPRHGRGPAVPAELLRPPRRSQGLPALPSVPPTCWPVRLLLFSLNFPAVDFLIPARTCSSVAVLFLFLWLFLCLDACSETCRPRRHHPSHHNLWLPNKQHARPTSRSLRPGVHVTLGLVLRRVVAEEPTPAHAGARGSVPRDSAAQGSSCSLSGSF